jgi:hypothetical protein
MGSDDWRVRVGMDGLAGAGTAAAALADSDPAVRGRSGCLATGRGGIDAPG